MMLMLVSRQKTPCNLATNHTYAALRSRVPVCDAVAGRAEKSRKGHLMLAMLWNGTMSLGLDFIDAVRRYTACR